MLIPVCLSGRPYAVLHAPGLKVAHRLVDAHNIYRRPLKCAMVFAAWIVSSAMEEV
jgi:hypothetical protein